MGGVNNKKGGKIFQRWGKRLHILVNKTGF